MKSPCAQQLRCAMAARSRFLLVERYDRAPHKNGTITRLHQEDFCQALERATGAQIRRRRRAGNRGGRWR
ncbi:HipA domain-containing protein [Rhizobium yanglingense]